MAHHPSSRARALDGGVAIVTGAGQGLGRVEALALAAGGAKVVLNDMSDKVEATSPTRSARRAARRRSSRGDVGDWTFSGSLIDTAVKTYGSLSILVNNAGFTRDKMIFSMTEDAFDDVVRVHLKGHMGTCRAATAYWREESKAAGGPVWASIINTASESFLFGAPGPAELLGREGRHRRHHPVHRPELREVRGPGERARAPGPHRDDRAHLRPCAD